MLASYYFIYEPVSIIIDIRELEYDWGNTILKSINFFKETGRDEDEKNRQVIIIVSPANKEAISDTLSIVENGNPEICHAYDTAINIASRNVNKYFSGK